MQDNHFYDERTIIRILNLMKITVTFIRETFYKTTITKYNFYDPPAILVLPLLNRIGAQFLINAVSMVT